MQHGSARSSATGSRWHAALREQRVWKRVVLLCALVVVAAMCRMGTAAEEDGVAAAVPAMDSTADVTTPRVSGPSVFSDATLFVTQDSPYRRQAAAWRSSRPADARIMDLLAQRPQAIWLGEWNENVEYDVREVMRLAAADKALPVFVVYFIPLRDCGSYSRGGAISASFYREWIGKIESAIGGAPAAVILEPDALAGIDCLAADKKAERIALIRGAVETLSKHANLSVYVDAGNARWKSPEEMARELKSVNIAAAAGFALNISNFLTTAESIEYGEKISALVGGKHFLIDTSRNGAGPTSDLAWCNPPGRALGARPTVNTGHALVDALLWIKRPGESDGECNGGPAAGVWWPEYALGLARRAGY